jgi:hypothetical protein
MSVTFEYLSAERVLIFHFNGSWTWEEYDTQLMQTRYLFIQFGDGHRHTEARCLDVIMDFTHTDTPPLKTSAYTIAPHWLQIESVQHLLLVGLHRLYLSPLETARRLSVFPEEYHMARTLHEAILRLHEVRDSDYSAYA